MVLPPPPTAGWWGDGPPPWERWPGVSLRIDAEWTGERWETLDGLYYFDADRADAPVDFGAAYLRPTMGPLVGAPLELLPWQRDLLVRPLFGWLRVVDGRRRFRQCYTEVAKKNGKSLICSVLGPYLAFADKEPGAHVYVAAGDEEQARIVWRESSVMLEASPEFLSDSGVEVLANALVQPSSNSTFRPLTAKAATKHGFSVHGLIFDELHAQKSRKLYETLKRGISSRLQPVILVITTAGDDRESICYEEHEYAVHVRDGVIDDPTWLPIVFQLATEDDWRDEATWNKVNPGLGAVKMLEYMRTECLAAQAEPRKRNDFLRLELNVWTESRTVWITPEAWNECEREESNPPSLLELPCCLGLDLSETTDLTALVAAFRRPDEREIHEVEIEGETRTRDRKILTVDFSVDLKAWFWLPRDRLLERSSRDGVPYDLWAREGWLTVTEGSIIDYREVRETVLSVVAKYDVRSCGFDPYNARQLATQLVDDGVPMVEVRQGMLTLNSPSKLLEGLVASKRITHDGNPLLRWCFANCEVKSDESGNIRPVKPTGDSRSVRRIDGVVATVIALSRLMVMEPAAAQPTLSFI